MAAEPNPYFDPYLHSATPAGRSGGSAYPTGEQHNYPPPQPGSPYYMQGQGNANTPGASTTGSQWELQGNGYGTPRESHGLLQQQQQAYYQQQQQQQQYSDYDQPYQQNQHQQQQQPYSDNGYGGAAGYGAHGQQPPRPASPPRADPTVGGEPVWSNEKSRAARAANGGSRKKWICIVVIVVVLAAAGAAVAVVLIKKKNDSDDKSSNNGTSSGQTGSPPSTGNSKFIQSGGDGSTITLSNGSQIVYNNKLGGNWLFDAANPFNGGQANSWTPPINESWTWGKDRIFGVNLGGWLQLEAFITPALFETTHTLPLDEWTMHTNLRRGSGGDAAAEKFMEDHFSTFITEADFAEIAGAGLNWVRLPLPWYAIEVWEGEPFVSKIQWKWFLKAIEWARKYGIRIQLDLHGVPGSQNGWNHSGRLMRYPTWLKTPMGLANVQRSLSYIRTITQFISQDQYTKVIPMFGIVNEPYSMGLADEPLKGFYMEAYKMIRGITGIGKGPVISIFAQGLLPTHWTQTFMQGADRIALDPHPYWAFSEQSSDGPETFRDRVCRAHAGNINATWNNVGIVTAGEWSLAINDCNKWVGQGMDQRYETKFGAGSCARWDNYAAWTPETRAGFLSFWRTQADALGDWFFWTWKIAPSAVTNKIEAPFWSYQLGLQEGWIPQDPRSAIGACAEFGILETTPRPTELKPSQVGLAPNAQPTDLNDYPWPPVALSDVPIATALPQYTPTGTIITMPGPTFTDPADPSKTIDAGSGWFNPQDTGGMYVPKSGCTYPDAWNANGLPIPAQCP